MGAFGKRKYFWGRNFLKAEARLCFVLLYSHFIPICLRLVQVKFLLQRRFFQISVDSELCSFFFHSIMKYFGKRLYMKLHIEETCSDGDFHVIFLPVL